MELEDYFEIGYIIKPHGLKGALNIHLDVDDPEQYKQMESVVVNQNNNLIPFFVSSIQINGSKSILTLEDIDTIEQAIQLKSATLLLPVEMLPKLKDGKFYYHDVIGFTIRDENLGELGVIENIFTGSNQDLISMRYKQKEVLIPISDELVKKADHEQKLVFVSLPDGLLEIYM